MISRQYVIDKVKIRFLSRIRYNILKKPEYTTRFSDDYVGCIYDILTSNISDNFHVFSVDCGLGKSTILKSFLEIFAEESSLHHHGVLICLSSYDEIRSYLDDLRIPSSIFAMLTADESLNARGVGSDRGETAPILFTTVQMLKSRTEGKTFASSGDFHFHGKARSCRVIDEGAAPYDPVIIRVDTLMAVPDALSKVNTPFVQALRPALDKLAGLKHGEVFNVPDGLPPVNPKEMVRRGDNLEVALHPDQITAVDALRAMSGKVMHAVAGGRDGLMLVQAVQALPDDIAPVIVMDGSARVNIAYHLRESYLSNIVIHPPIANSYAHLNIKVWKTACGNSSLQKADTRERIFDEIINLINLDDNEWLIINYKAHEKGLSEAVRLSVSRPERVSFRNWGRHYATNEFRDVKRMIIVGSWLKSQACYTGQFLAATGGKAPDRALAEWRDMKASQYQHDAIQAICRSNVRNSRDGVAGECIAYVIASKDPNPFHSLSLAFPDANIEQWNPVPVSLSPRSDGILSLIRDAKNAGSLPIRTIDICKRACIRTPQQFSNIVRSQAFTAALRDMGITKLGQKFCLVD